MANILRLIFFLVERGRGAFVTFMISLRRIQMFLLTSYLLIVTMDGLVECNLCALFNSAVTSDLT